MNKFRLLSLGILSLLLAACNLNAETQNGAQSLMQQDSSPTPSATATIDDALFAEPLPTLTPSNTLRPAPTFEPPTLTPEPSNTPTITPTPTILIQGDLPPLQGLETQTPVGGEDCVPDEDWQLRYEVQPGDAVASIAAKYGTYATDLAEGNCLADMNLVRVGQILRVPGVAHPSTPEFDCTWELLTPLNGTITVPGEGTITFNWRGPETSRYLVRVYNSVDGTGNHILEYMSEYNEFVTMNLSDLPAAGTFSWRVFPLNWEFTQIPCPESYSSRFTKAVAPPTQTIGGVGTP